MACDVVAPGLMMRASLPTPSTTLLIARCCSVAGQTLCQVAGGSAPSPAVSTCWLLVRLFRCTVDHLAMRAGLGRVAL